MKTRKQKKQIRSNKRIYIHNAESPLALAGYWTPQVQRVVKKWRGRVLERFIRTYFLAIAPAAFWNANEINMQVWSRAHWPLVWELAAAVEKVRCVPKSHPHHWLLRLHIQVASNGGYDLWKEIAWKVKERGGPRFSEMTLRQAAKRLHLATPTKTTAPFLRTSLASF